MARNYIAIKFLPGTRVRVTRLFHGPAEISSLIDAEGVITAIYLANSDDPSQGVLYSVKFGDWLLTDCDEGDLEKYG